MLRRQLPVSSPVDPGSLVRASWEALKRRPDAGDAVVGMLASKYGARQTVLTDSGTSALVLALRAVVGHGGTVALPGYCCIDLTAASRFAGVRVRLYDLDPHTLSVDLDSLAGALERGVEAVVVAHLFGFPVDMPAVMSLAAAHGIPVIEDAAQGAGGTLNGRVLGSFGDLSIVSFGRGKGTTGGRGGAVMAHTADAARRLESLGSGGRRPPPAGWRDVAAAAVQWAFGRPALYGIPSSIPALRLGEMVYRPAHEPAPLSAAAATLVRRAFVLARVELAARRANANLLRAAMPANGVVQAVRPIAGAEPGYLRFPVLGRSLHDAPAMHLGIVPGYPRTLFEQHELRRCLHADEREHAGARELRRSLVTLPTHGQLTATDRDRLVRWLRQAQAAPAVSPTHTTEPVTHALDG